MMNCCAKQRMPARELAKIHALYRLLGGEVSRRSLQRRLSQFVAAGLLMTKGGGRSTRYLLRPTVEVKIEEDSFAFSPSGIAVRHLVRRPLRERTPVGYNREFLEKYKPNESSYLSSEIIAHLNRIGRTPDAERPAGTYARHILDRLLVGKRILGIVTTRR